MKVTVDRCQCHLSERSILGRKLMKFVENPLRESDSLSVQIALGTSLNFLTALVTKAAILFYINRVKRIVSFIAS